MKAGVRFRPPEAKAALARLELAREHLQAREWEEGECTRSGGEVAGSQMRRRLGMNPIAGLLGRGFPGAACEDLGDAGHVVVMGAARLPAQRAGPARPALPPRPPAPDAPQAACAAAWRQFLARFADQYLPFRAAVQALAALDCLAGLARVATTPGWAGQAAGRPSVEAAEGPSRARARAAPAASAAQHARSHACLAVLATNGWHPWYVACTNMHPRVAGRPTARRYCRPQLLDPGASPPQLHIEAGRHPVVELLLEGEGAQFVPNDTHLQARRAAGGGTSAGAAQPAWFAAAGGLVSCDGGDNCSGQCLTGSPLGLQSQQRPVV